MNRIASCPHCGARPRYGLLEHIQWCNKRPSEASLAPHDAEVEEALETAVGTVAEPPPATRACAKCGKALKLRGAHFHERACKG